MKKILYTALISVMAFGATSCNDFLTVEPQDSLMAENYYTSASAVRANTAVLYASYPWFDFHNGFMFYAGDMRAGDLYYTYDAEGQFYYNSVTTTNSYMYGAWKSLYRIVSFANSVLNDMPSPARENGVSESAITAAMGEAYCMRAMAYFILAEYWGEVPIIENATPLITSSVTTDIYVNKHTHESLYKFMIRDLEKAIEYLPETDSDAGRVTKASAYGLLAKVYVTYAAYAMNESTDQSAAELYGLAKKTAAACIETGIANGYGMWSDYSTMYDVGANNCCESLIAIQCQSGGYGEGNARNANFSRSSRIADQTWGAGKGPTLHLQSLYSSDDARRKWIYMTNGDYYANLASEDGGYTYQYSYRDPNNLDTQVEAYNNVLAHCKKYVIGKSADCGGCVGLNQDAGNNLYLLRFTDVMMIYIEACIGTGKSTADGTAIDYMGQILSRAGLSNTYSSITYDQLIEERRKEFALEGMSWFDVMRIFYRDHQSALDYLHNMERDRIYVFNWSGSYFTYDSSGNATYTISEQYVWENNINYYTTIWEDMDITSSNADNTTNEDYYKGADWLKENGHRVDNIKFYENAMYLAIPESELTNAPILNEAAVEYTFDE